MLSLKAKERKVHGRTNSALRRTDWVPAVVYGKGFKNADLQVEYNPFVKVLKQVGYSSLVDLEVEGQSAPLKVLIQDLQKHPVTDRIIHIDLRQVNLNEKVESKISLKFVGESSAVRELKAVLVKNLTSIHVLALPMDLVPEIEVSLEALKKFGDRVLIKDIKLPKGIEVKQGADEIVANVSEFVEEKADVVPVTEADAVAGVGTVEKKKVEGEEGAAGAEGTAKEGGKADAGKKEAAPAKPAAKK